MAIISLHFPIAHRNTHSHLPGFLVLDDGWQLLVIPHQDESLDVKQRGQAHRLADLRRLVHDAEVKPATREDGVFGAHAGGGHHQLEGEGGRERRGREGGGGEGGRGLAVYFFGLELGYSCPRMNACLNFVLFPSKFERSQLCSLK